MRLVLRIATLDEDGAEETAIIDRNTGTSVLEAEAAAAALIDRYHRDGFCLNHHEQDIWILSHLVQPVTLRVELVYENTTYLCN